MPNWDPVNCTCIPWKQGNPVKRVTNELSEHLHNADGMLAIQVGLCLMGKMF